MTTATVGLADLDLPSHIQFGNHPTAGVETGGTEDVWQGTRLLRGLGQSMLTAALLGCTGLLLGGGRGRSQEVPTVPSVVRLEYPGSGSLVHAAAVSVEEVAFAPADLRLIPFEERIGPAMSHADLVAAYAQHGPVAPEPEDLFELPDFLR
jgi:hypothetical protein